MGDIVLLSDCPFPIHVVDTTFKIGHLFFKNLCSSQTLQSIPTSNTFMSHQPVANQAGVLFGLLCCLFSAQATATTKPAVVVLVLPSQQLKTSKQAITMALHDVNWRQSYEQTKHTKLANISKVARAKCTKEIRAVVWRSVPSEAYPHTFLHIFVCHEIDGTKKLITRALSQQGQHQEMGLILRQLLPTLPQTKPTTKKPRPTPQRQLKRIPKEPSVAILSRYGVAIDARVGLHSYARAPVALGQFQLGAEWRFLRHIGLHSAFGLSQPVNEVFDKQHIQLSHQTLHIGLGHYWAFVRGRLRLGIEMLRESTEGTLKTTKGTTTIDHSRWFAAPHLSWHQHLHKRLSTNIYAGMRIAPRGIVYTTQTTIYPRWRLMPYVQIGVQYHLWMGL